MQHKWKNKGNTFSILTVLRITYEILNSASRLFLKTYFNFRTNLLIRV